MGIKRIVFVCTGNSCRSVMAQAVMRHTLAQRGLGSIVVESAGVLAVNGMGATRETQTVLRAAGLDGSRHHARALSSDMIEAADLLLVMEPFHAQQILRRAPSAAGKVHLLKTYGLTNDPSIANPQIPDPIGKPLEVYEVCFNEIREAVERVAEALCEHGPHPS